MRANEPVYLLLQATPVIRQMRWALACISPANQNQKMGSLPIWTPLPPERETLLCGQALSRDYHSLQLVSCCSTLQQKPDHLNPNVPRDTTGNELFLFSRYHDQIENHHCDSLYLAFSLWKLNGRPDSSFPSLRPSWESQYMLLGTRISQWLVVLLFCPHWVRHKAYVRSTKVCYMSQDYLLYQPHKY